MRWYWEHTLYRDPMLQMIHYHFNSHTFIKFHTFFCRDNGPQTIRLSDGYKYRWFLHRKVYFQCPKHRTMVRKVSKIMLFLWIFSNVPQFYEWKCMFIASFLTCVNMYAVLYLGPIFWRIHLISYASAYMSMARLVIRKSLEWSMDLRLTCSPMEVQ